MKIGSVSLTLKYARFRIVTQLHKSKYRWIDIFEILLCNVSVPFISKKRKEKKTHFWLKRRCHTEHSLSISLTSSLWLSLPPPPFLPAFFFPLYALSIREAVSTLWCDYRSSRQNSPETCHPHPPTPSLPQRAGPLWKLLYVPLFNWLATALIITDTGPGFEMAWLR